MIEIKSDGKGAYYVEHDRRTNFHWSSHVKTFDTQMV